MSIDEIPNATLSPGFAKEIKHSEDALAQVVPLQESNSSGLTRLVNILEQPNKIGAEIGGRVGPEPTRYGDWEKNGRCIDF